MSTNITIFAENAQNCTAYSTGGCDSFMAVGVHLESMRQTLYLSVEGARALASDLNNAAADAALLKAPVKMEAEATPLGVTPAPLTADTQESISQNAEVSECGGCRAPAPPDELQQIYDDCYCESCAPEARAEAAAARNGR